MKGLNSNKRFWKKIERFFSDKGLQTNNIIIKNKNRFVTIVHLKLKPSMSKSKSLSALLKLYEDHFSALKIKENIKYKINYNLETFPQMK